MERETCRRPEREENAGTQALATLDGGDDSTVRVLVIVLDRSCMARGLSFDTNK